MAVHGGRHQNDLKEGGREGRREGVNQSVGLGSSLLSSLPPSFPPSLPPFLTFRSGREGSTSLRMMRRKSLSRERSWT